MHVHLAGISQKSGIVDHEVVHYYRKGIANIQYPDPAEGDFDRKYENLLLNLATALGSIGMYDEEREIVLSIQQLDEYANCDSLTLDLGTTNILSWIYLPFFPEPSYPHPV